MVKRGVFYPRCYAISSTLLQLLSSHYSRPTPFPCSVTSLGRTGLFKALELQACARSPIATRNLAWAIGKRKISASSHTLHLRHTLTKSVYRIYPDNTLVFMSNNMVVKKYVEIMGLNMAINKE